MNAKVAVTSFKNLSGIEYARQHMNQINVQKEEQTMDTLTLLTLAVAAISVAFAAHTRRCFNQLEGHVKSEVASATILAKVELRNHFTAHLEEELRLIKEDAYASVNRGWSSELRSVCEVSTDAKTRVKELDKKVELIVQLLSISPKDAS